LTLLTGYLIRIAIRRKRAKDKVALIKVFIDKTIESTADQIKKWEEYEKTLAPNTEMELSFVVPKTPISEFKDKELFELHYGIKGGREGVADVIFHFKSALTSLVDLNDFSTKRHFEFEEKRSVRISHIMDLLSSHKAEVAIADYKGEYQSNYPKFKTFITSYKAMYLPDKKMVHVVSNLMLEAFNELRLASEIPEETAINIIQKYTNIVHRTDEYDYMFRLRKMEIKSGCDQLKRIKDSFEVIQKSLK